MSATTVTLILVGAVQILTLALLARVVRRLGDVERRGPGPVHDPGPGAGTGLERFVGRPVPATGPPSAAVPGLIGFFSADCAPCHGQAPYFARLAATDPDGPTLAVVAGPPGAARDELVSTLAGTTVLTGPPAAELLRTFDVDVFPTLLRTDGHRVLAAAVVVDELGAPAPVAP